MKRLYTFLVFFIISSGISTSFPAEEIEKADFVKQADQAILDGRYTEAVTLLRKAVDRNPEDWDARMKLIGLLVQVAGKEDEAVEELDAVLELEVVDREYLEKIATVCEEYDFPDEAVKLYNKILEQEGMDAAVQRKIIDVLVRSGDSEGASREINIYVENTGFTRDDLIKLGEFCEKKLQFVSAAAVYEKIVEKHPEYIQARLSLANSYARSGNLDEAKSTVEKCLEAQPGDPGAMIFLASLKADSGDYDKALDLYDEVLGEHPEYVGIHADKADVLFTKGRYKEAEADYKKAISTSKTLSSHLKKLADLYKYTGRYEEAETLYQKAVTANPSSTDAIIGLAESYLLHGKLDEAEDELHKLYDLWDAIENPRELSPQVLTNIGLACQYNDNPEDALTCYTMALEKDTTYFEARLALGQLFLERHQEHDAEEEFNGLLEVNPNHPDALSGLATVYLMRGRYELVEDLCESALSINPNHIESLNIMASMQMLDRQWDKAIESINKALKVNPNSLETQSYLAAYYYHTVKDDSYKQVEKKVLSINPRYAEFYQVVSFVAERQRRNEEAIDLLRKAIKINPNHAPSYAAIGTILMREGIGDSAEEYLNTAFELDPYNPRMANSINLLNYIKRDFVTEETKNFIVRWDSEKDFVLKHFLPQYVEKAYPVITDHFGYKPPAKTVFDMFPDHKWFSARISGMPFIATVGASFGKIFAMDSPKNSAFNWRKVLEHEFTHVITLQQTNFNITFWFTEGIATRWEQSPRIVDWDRMLVRMKVFDKLVPLDELDSWFTRPKSMDYRQWAYAQSELTVEYIYDKWGREAIVKMLNMYAENKSTEEIIKECLGISQDEFEKKVHSYCMSVAAKIPVGPKFLVGDRESLEELLEKYPENPEHRFNYARLLVQTIAPMMKSDEVNEILDEARRYAREAIDLKSKSPTPYITLAVCDIQQDKFTSARKYLEEALKIDRDNFPAHYYLGKLCFNDKDFDKAIEHFEKAKAFYPKITEIQKVLAGIYVDRNEIDKVIENLEEIIAYSNTPYDSAKQLLELYVESERYDDAIRVADICLCYNLYDPEIYKLAGDAYKAKADDVSLKRFYSIGSEVAYRLGSTEVRKDLARKYLTLTLEMDPNHEQAKELLEKIEGLDEKENSKD